MNQDENFRFMKIAIHLANKGKGKTSPNPPVGAVIVKHGKIIGKGYHKRAGQPHAEVNAFNSADISCRGAVLYVTLEPCCFTGKTPPCTDLIIKKGIKKVIIGSLDPNPRVAGRGIKLLKKAGVKVEYGYLKEETDLLIEEFRKFILTGKPFVTVKSAITLDGKIATRTGHSKWITSESSRNTVHRLRGINDAILVGSGTILKDNPSLNVRFLKGYNDPVRVVLDKHLTIKTTSNIFKIPGNNIIFTSSKVSFKKFKKFDKFENTKLVKLNLFKNKFNWEDILDVLGDAGIISVLVEGGSKIISSLVKSRAIDKYIFFISPKFFSDNSAIPFSSGLITRKVQDGIKLSNIQIKIINPDIYLSGYPIFGGT